MTIICPPNSDGILDLLDTRVDDEYLNPSNHEIEFSSGDDTLSPNINCTPIESIETVSGSPGLLTYYYVPDLGSIHTSIRWGFLLHAYGFACLFFFLAFYAFFSILNLRSQLSTRPYMSTINSFLCLLGVSRAAVLFIDPYGLKRTLPPLLGSLLWDLGFPCLISSFSLIQIAFLQLTQLEVGPESLRKKTILSIVITTHFVTVMGTAIYSNINSDFVILKLGFQLGFGLWGLVLCGSFLWTGRRVLGILGYSPGSSNESANTGINEKGVAGLMMASMMAPGQNLASSLTAALAPTLLQSTPMSTGGNSHTPKIKITDENDRTVSVASDSSRNAETALTTDPASSTANTQQRPSTSGKGTNRPPSPVLPRKKSGGSGTALRNSAGSTSLQGPGTLTGRKKSLTFAETDSSTNGKDKEEIKSESTSLLVTANEKRRGSRKSMDLSEEQRGGGESLLISSGGPGPDYTLQSILSHIAYVNQTALDYRLSRKLSRKNQVQKVIRFTSITAGLGIFLCLGELVRIISPYGLLVSSVGPPGPWPWFALQTFSRVIEFVMSAVIANISKQPVSRPHHYAAYALRHKHQRDSLYL